METLEGFNLRKLFNWGCDPNPCPPPFIPSYIEDLIKRFEK